MRYGTGAFIDTGHPSRDHPLAPWHVNGSPFTLIVVGRHGGGKSEAMANLYAGSTLEHVVYDIRPGIRHGVKVDKRLVYPDHILYLTTNPDKSRVNSLRSMVEFLGEHELDDATFNIIDICNDPPLDHDELDPKTCNILLFDDSLEGRGLIRKECHPFVRDRHKNASVILLVQSWYDLPPTIQRNATTVAMVGSSSAYRHITDVVRQLM